MITGHMNRRRQTLIGTLVLIVYLSATPAPAAEVGTVLYHQKISDTEGGFTGELNDEDWFGLGTAGIGDLDGDGVVDGLDLMELIDHFGPCP